MNDENKQELTESRLDEKRVFSGRLLDVSINRVRGPNGRVSEREVVHHPGGVVILPVREGKSGREIVLVKQYRDPAGKTLWELPAGTLEEGETAEDCARRELIEETRFTPDKLEKRVDLYTSPGYSDEVLSLYIATGLEKVDESHPVKSPKDENLITKSFKVEELVKKANLGEIRDGKTLAGLFFLTQNNI